MRKSKYSEEQIIGFIKQVEAGMSLKELRKRGQIPSWKRGRSDRLRIRQDDHNTVKRISEKQPRHNSVGWLGNIGIFTQCPIEYGEPAKIIFLDKP